MTRVLQASVHVSYSQAYIEQAGAAITSMEDSFAGQTNGTCGAVVVGTLFLVTGTHTGAVPFVVDVHTEEPPLDAEYDDVVEVSFQATTSRIWLTGWGGESSAMFALTPGAYRVRYSARGVDQGHQSGGRMDDEPIVDSYRLQFWPAPPRADAVVRQTSDESGFAHRRARSLAPPPTAEELLAARRADADRLRAEALALALAVELERWGGRPPSDRLRQVGGNVSAVVRSDRDLLDEFDALSDQVQRAAARWLTHRAFAFAGLSERAWVQPALDSLDAGLPLPPPFTHLDHAFTALLADEHQTGEKVVSFITTERLQPCLIHRPSFALPTIFAAIHPDSLDALINAFSNATATFDDQREMLVAELRRRFLD